MKCHLLLILTFNLITISYSQNDAFYLKYLTDDKYEFQNSTIPFASQAGDKLFYLRNYNIRAKSGSNSLVTGYDNYLIMADLNGNILKEYNLSQGTSSQSRFIAVRHFDRIILLGSYKNDISNEMQTFTFDLDLNLVSSTIKTYEDELVEAIFFPIYFNIDDKLYVAMNNVLDDQGGIAFRFDKEGTLELEKAVRQLDGTSISGITSSFHKDKILFCTSDNQIPSLISFDLDFNYLSSKKMYSTSGEINYKFHLFSKFIKKDNGYIGFGRAFRQKNDSTLVGKFTSELDTNLVPTGKYYIDNTQETGYTDGAPRFTGGLFEGKEGYYTIYEILTGQSTRYSSTFIVNKYDFMMDPVWEKRFIADDSIKFWNYYAEFTADDRFIFSGETTDFTKSNGQKDRFFGHIIGLDPNGNSNTSAVKSSQNIFLFSILGNPVTDHLLIEKLIPDEKKYSIQIVNINGKIISTTSWSDRKIELNVSKLPPGTFICRILDGTQIKYSGKFIKL